MSSFSARAELERLRAHYRRIAELLESEELARLAPEVSGWSSEQHLAHLALANELAFRNVQSLLAGSGLFVVEEGEPVPQALAVLESGLFPPRAAQAPRMVRPPDKVERGLLLGWIADNRRDFEALSGRELELEAAPRRVPHQLMGPLSAIQWLRFAAIHTGHHLAICGQVGSADRKG